MPYFTVTYRYIPDADSVAAVRPRHRDYMSELADQGRLVIGGPNSGDPAGALLVYQVTDEETVRHLTAADPFVSGGIVSEYVIRPWKPVLGSRIAHF